MICAGKTTTWVAFAWVVFALIGLACFATRRSSDHRISPSSVPTRDAIAFQLELLHGAPCVGRPDFICVNFPVPLDHEQPKSKTIHVTFAVKVATADTRASSDSRKGAIVYLEGGPGYSGIEYVDDYEEISTAIEKNYDIISLDIRGAHRSGGLDCPEATSRYYDGGLRDATPDESARLVQKAKTFAHDCVAEMGVLPQDLTHYSTFQAAHDLEAFRKLMGYDRFVIHGQSYGTQLAQTYAHLFRDHVESLILDGAVDLSLTHLQYVQATAIASEEVLQLSLLECKTRPECVKNFGPEGIDPHKAFQHFARNLIRHPLTLSIRSAEDGFRKFIFNRSKFDMLTAEMMADEASRLRFLKAVADAEIKQNYDPLARLAYDQEFYDASYDSFSDHQFEKSIDTSYEVPNNLNQGDYKDISTGIYFTFTCNDYGRDKNNDDHSTLRGSRGTSELEQWLGAGRALNHQSVTSQAPLYGDLPCLFWPTKMSSKARPHNNFADSHHLELPMLVVSARGDVFTPFEMGLRIAQANPRSIAVAVEGGHHIMANDGHSCIDQYLKSFLLDQEKNTLPGVYICDGTYLEF